MLPKKLFILLSFLLFVSFNYGIGIVKKCFFFIIFFTTAQNYMGNKFNFGFGRIFLLFTFFIKKLSFLFIYFYSTNHEFSQVMSHEPTKGNEPSQNVKMFDFFSASLISSRLTFGGCSLNVKYYHFTLL